MLTRVGPQCISRSLRTETGIGTNQVKLRCQSLILTRPSCLSGERRKNSLGESEMLTECLDNVTTRVKSVVWIPSGSYGYHPAISFNHRQVVATDGQRWL
jgi:hypothetical protein